MCGYTVFDGEKLPDGLSNEENIFYHREYRLGNNGARDMLIKHNLRLVLTVVMNRFGKLNYDIEDLVSIGIIGLIKGIDNYDELRGNNISSYFYGCVVYEILHFLRDDCKYNKEIELVCIDDIAIDRDGDVVSKGEILNSCEELIEDRIIDELMNEYYKNIVYDILAMLNDRDRMIIMLYFGFIDGKVYKQREIASMMNVSRGVVSMSIVRSLDKLKNRLLFVEKKKILK